MEKRKRIKKRMKGITLIELLVVVAIITILAAILLPYISHRTEDARIAAMEEMISSLRSATTLMFNDMSLYPTYWHQFIVAPNPIGNWRGPYLQRSLTTLNVSIWSGGSPWKTNLQLITVNNVSNYRFASAGNLFPLRYGICLVLFNPLNGTAHTIPFSSLQKIDTDLDDGAHDRGYIVHSSTGPTTGVPFENPPGTMNFVAYTSTSTSTNTTHLYILINAIP
jgi:prepilin-type N-terminal cleavage/methylation domain-containing protein